MHNSMAWGILKKTAIGLCAAVVASQTWASEVWRKSGYSDGGGTSSFNTGAGWGNNEAPSAANTYRWTDGTFRTPDTRSGSYVFQGSKITFGKSSTIAHKTYKDGYVEFPNVVFDGENIWWSIASEGVSGRIGGNIYIESANPLQFGVNRGTSNVFIMEARFHGNNSTVIDLTHTCTDNIPDDSTGTLRLLGDNADYYGKMRVYNRGVTAKAGVVLSLESKTAAGGIPESLMPDAITLSNDGGLAVAEHLCAEGPYAPANRGVTIVDVGRFTTISNETWALGMPVTGAGKLLKTGSGTVVLAGEYSAGTVEVAAGTLALAPGFSVTTAFVPAVADVAAFEVRATDAEGFTLSNVTLPVMTRIVGFMDNETDQSTPVVLDASCNLSEGPYVLDLSVRPVSDAGKSYPVVRIPTSVKVVTAADFTSAVTSGGDGTPFPFYGVEIEMVDGMQTVSIHRRAVVRMSEDTANKNTINGGQWYIPDAVTWEDGCAPSPGKDYYIDRGAYSTLRTGAGVNGLVDFAGGSLTLGANKTLAHKAVELHVDQFYVMPKAIVNAAGNGGAGNQKISGKMTLLGNENNEANRFNFYSCDNDNSKQNLELTCDISGMGRLYLMAYDLPNVTQADVTAASPTLSGDNSKFFGELLLYSAFVSAGRAEEGVTLNFTRPEALGGPRENFVQPAYKMIEVMNGCGLHPTVSMTMETANRGIQFTGATRVIVDEGQTFTLNSTLTYNRATVSKVGAGTLKLGGGVRVGARDESTPTGADNILYVKEGWLKPGSVTPFKPLKLRFAAAGGLRLDEKPTDENVATYGLFNTFTPEQDTATGEGSFVLDGDSLKVAIDLASPETQRFLVPICTVPSALAAKLEGKIVVEKPKSGLSVAVVKDTVELEGVAYTRFSAKGCLSGMTIMFR